MRINPPARVIVGVVPGRTDAVVEQAAVFAAHFNAELVCAYVDVSRYVVKEHADGTVSSLPFDPSLPGLGGGEFEAELRAQLAAVLDARGAVWSTRALAGDPARALDRLAVALDAAMIVVGTRDESVKATVQEFLSGSVAVHLAHRQHRPVVVIPQAPVSFEDALPGESA